MSTSATTHVASPRDVFVGDLRMFIDGEWADPANGRRLPIFNPGTAAEIGTLPDAGADDVDRAVRAAHREFADGAGEWPSKSLAERRTILERVLARLDERVDEIAALESADAGMTYRNALAFHAQGAPQFLRDSFAQAPSEVPQGLPMMEIPTLSANYLVREPIGVIAAMPPSNAGYMMSLYKSLGALVCGNTVVLKPSPLCSVTATVLAEEIAAEEAIPAGAFNLVLGDAESGASLAAHPLVGKITFTGSAPTAKRVMQAAAPNLTGLTLELGGKGPAVLCDDANLDVAIDGILWGILWVSGQACIAGSRLLVSEAMHDTVVERLTARMRDIRVGDPADPDTDFGPVASKEAVHRINEAIRVAREKGVDVIQAELPDDLGPGYFVAPTILDGVANDMPVAREETFGPVLSVITYRDLDEAVAIANDSNYGLSATVWSTDNIKAVALARRLRVGTVWINEHHILNPRIPFGGYKQSGMGREFGALGMEGFTELKHVHIDLSPSTPNPAWAILLGH
jgi:acyl-CoA reductase-like NAD-dependent aldehyde dehydrogenase